MPKILSFGYVDDVTIPHTEDPHRYADHWEGALIKMTDDRELYVVIDNEPQCCENWGVSVVQGDGYVDLPPDWPTFVGAEFLGTHVDSGWLGGDDGGKKSMFVDITTDMGTATVHLYNSHNGYYGHACRVFLVYPELVTERRGMHTVVTKQMKVTALHGATL